MKRLLSILPFISFLLVIMLLSLSFCIGCAPRVDHPQSILPLPYATPDLSKSQLAVIQIDVSKIQLNSSYSSLFVYINNREALHKQLSDYKTATDEILVVPGTHDMTLFIYGPILQM